MRDAEDLVLILKSKRLHISTAESCTGGKIASAIVDMSGASSVFDRGYITYANEAKEDILNVQHKTLEEFGAVSKETAIEMAKGCALVSNADISIVSTGIAGPEGGTKEKPVGLVYIACYYRDAVYVEKHLYHGNRNDIRRKATASAVKLALQTLKR